ncbi:hypothetical protein OG225_26220 [Nocardia sp. NBC_01377]|uniref:hypothetical protein n=1 Tax=Nocardia sp. NBC_01377 TaxID=2903595 RepID=UPI003245336B
MTARAWGTSILACVLAVVATVLVAPATATASGTPRAQFWDEPNFQGHKLDKDVSFDVPGGQQQDVADLSREGLSCWFCEGNWDNRIVSLSTTGGGQEPVNLIIWNSVGMPRNDGYCVFIPKGVEISNLYSKIPLRNRGGEVIEGILGPTISSFVVTTRENPDLPPECFVYAGA